MVSDRCARNAIKGNANQGRSCREGSGRHSGVKLESDSIATLDRAKVRRDVSNMMSVAAIIGYCFCCESCSGFYKLLLVFIVNRNITQSVKSVVNRDNAFPFDFSYVATSDTGTGAFESENSESLL